MPCQPSGHFFSSGFSCPTDGMLLLRAVGLGEVRHRVDWQLQGGLVKLWLRQKGTSLFSNRPRSVQRFHVSGVAHPSSRQMLIGARSSLFRIQKAELTIWNAPSSGNCAEKAACTRHCGSRIRDKAHRSIAPTMMCDRDRQSLVVEGCEFKWHGPAGRPGLDLKLAGSLQSRWWCFCNENGKGRFSE